MFADNVDIFVGSLARGSNVGVEESRRSKPATATASVSAVSGNVTKTRQLQKQTVQGF